MSTQLVRTVTDDGRKAKKARRSNRMLRMPLGLQRYISTRGTPKGTYEVCRTVVGKFDYNNTGGIYIGSAYYQAGTFTISPQSVTLVSGVPGNTTVWNIPNASELSALWDKVKIDKVEFTFSTGVIGASNNGTQPPLFVFASDDNDTNCSLDSICQIGDVRTWTPGNQSNGGVFKVTVRPKFQRLVYYSTLSDSYEATSGYVASNYDIPHYGLKMGINLSNAIGNINFSAKIYFKLRELK